MEGAIKILGLGKTDPSYRIGSGQKKGENAMKKTLVIMITVIIALFGVSISAYAESALEVDADFVYIPACYAERWAGDNQFLYCTDTAEWTGDFVGVSNEKYVAVLHGSEGNFVFEKGFYKGTVIFTGDVAGSEGTLKMLFVGKSRGDINDWIGTWRIISGEGGLANLHGQGTFYNNGPLDIHMDGKIRFAP
jgi:hypothetical protein